MLLETYLEQTGLTQREFAKRSNVSNKTIWSVIHGTDIRLSIALKIEKASHGLVTCKDLSKVKRRKKLVLPALELPNPETDQGHHEDDTENHDENTTIE